MVVRIGSEADLDGLPAFAAVLPLGVTATDPLRTYPSLERP